MPLPVTGRYLSLSKGRSLARALSLSKGLSLRGGLIAMIACALQGLSAQAQSLSSQKQSRWQPNKAITMIVPSNPGGGWDQTGRFLQRAIIENDLSPVSVDVINRGGAGGTIGLAELVERYPADPHKLIVSGFGMTGSILMHSSKHNLLSATPIARLTSEYQAIGVPAASPFQTLDDLITAFKKDPKSFTWGGGSAGGSDHIFAYLIAEATGVDAANVNYVAFTGGGEAAAALLGGQVSAAISGYGEWGGLADSGRVRLLAVSAENRLPKSGVPTFRELGFDLVFANWRAILAAPGITHAQKAWFTDVITKAQASDEWQEILTRNSWSDSFLTGNAFEQFIIEDGARTARILQRVGLSGSSSWAAVGPYLFPGISIAGLILFGGIILWSGHKQANTKATASMAGEIAQTACRTDAIGKTERPETGVPQTKSFFLAAGTLLAYIFGLKFIGFIYVTPLVIIALSYLMGSRSLIRDGIVGVSLTGIILLIFEHLLNVGVP